MFAKRLVYLRQREKLSQAELAEYCNVSQQAVGLWERGKTTPDYSTLLKIAARFSVSVDYLLGNEDFEGNIISKSGIKIPVLGNVPAGIPLEAITDIIDYEEISPAIAACGEYFALRIKGDSMAPRICDGDVVIVKREATVESGDVAIVMVGNNEAACKEVQFSQAGLTLVGWNIAAFSPMFFTKEDVEKLPVRIIGRVVEVRIKNLKRGR